MYKLELQIYLIVDGSVSNDSVDVSVEGEDVEKLKERISGLVLSALAPFDLKRCECLVEMLIEKDGEYYDHDDAFVVADLENNKLTMGVEKSC